MPHGKPDWGVDWTPRTVYGLEDMGEHAVRLGSPHLWDRRGDVIFLCDFANGLEGAHPIVTGANSTIELWTGWTRQGAYHVRVDAEHGLNNHASLEWFLPFPVTSGMGAEFSFHSLNIEGLWYITIEARNSVQWNRGGVALDINSGILAYWNAANLPTYLPARAEWQVDIDQWHTLKLVTMFDHGMYNRVILDDDVYDMRALPLFTAGVLGNKYLHVMMGKLAHLLVDTAGYMDNVIITQNES